MTELRRIKAIRPVAPSTIHIKWRDGGADVVDLAGAIADFAPFAPLRDPALFAKAKIAAYGAGIEWPNGLDYSADSLAHIAAEQRAMSGADFRRWQSEMGLSLQETADALGVTVTTVKNYRNAEAVPVAVSIACAALARRDESFFARYRPRTLGRPRLTRSAPAPQAPTSAPERKR